MSLTPADRERAEELAIAVYRLVAPMICNEPGFTGDRTARVAADTAMAFFKAFSAPGVALCHPDGPIPAPER